MSRPLTSLQSHSSKSRSKKSPLSQQISEFLSLISLPGLDFLGHETLIGQVCQVPLLGAVTLMKSTRLDEMAWFPKENQGVVIRRNGNWYGTDTDDCLQCLPSWQQNGRPWHSLLLPWSQANLGCFQRRTWYSRFKSHIYLFIVVTLGQTP